MDVLYKKPRLEKPKLHLDLLLEIVQRLRCQRSIVRIALCSKECLNLWKEVRLLKLILPKCWNIERFNGLITKCISECVDIRRFHLNVEERGCSAGQLGAWASMLQKQKVETLHIEMRFPMASTLPKEFNMCYLKDLHLVNTGVRPDAIIVPFLNGIKSLVKVRLHNIALVPNQNKSSYFIMDIPTLKLLIVEVCSHQKIKQFTVNCLALEYLEVRNSMFTRCNTCHFVMNAPKLQTINFAGELYMDYSFGKFEQLESAFFEFSTASIDQLQRFLCAVSETCYLGLTCSSVLTGELQPSGCKQYARLQHVELGGLGANSLQKLVTLFGTAIIWM